MSWRRGNILHWKRVCNFMIITLDWPGLEELWYFPKISSGVGKELFDTESLKENSDKE